MDTFVECGSDADANSHSNPDRDTHADADSYSDADPDAHSDANSAGRSVNFCDINVFGI